MWNRRKKQQATELIARFFRSMRYHGPEMTDESRRVAQVAGKTMVEVYRALTGEMPQAAGISDLFRGDEMPAIEWASPTERDPNDLYYVIPDAGDGPDILIKGDQEDGNTQEDHQEKVLEEKARQVRSRLLSPKE